MMTKIKNYIGVKDKTKAYPEWTGWQMTDQRRRQMREEIAEFLAYGEDADKTPDEVASTIVAIVDKCLTQDVLFNDGDDALREDKIKDPTEEDECQN